MRQVWGIKRLPDEPAPPSAMLFYPLIYACWQVYTSSTLLFPKNEEGDKVWERSVGINKARSSKSRTVYQNVLNWSGLRTD